MIETGRYMCKDFKVYVLIPNTDSLMTFLSLGILHVCKEKGVAPPLWNHDAGVAYSC